MGGGGGRGRRLCTHSPGIYTVLQPGQGKSIGLKWISNTDKMLEI